MSDTNPPADHAGDQVADRHGASHVVAGEHGSTADHGDGHGHDDHAHGQDALGPVDWPMWGVGVLGVIVGLVVAAGFSIASGFSFSM